MAYDYSDLVEKTQRWAEQASASGWINADAAASLSQLDTRTPEALFQVMVFERAVLQDRLSWLLWAAPGWVKVLCLIVWQARP